MAAGIFDLNTPSQFFDSIRRILDRYKSSNAKDIEDLLYVLMGLNHLREWISPGYDPFKRQPQNPQEHFYNAIWENHSFKKIKALCNRTKHLQPISEKTSSTHGIPLDDWPNVDAVRNFDLGPPSNYFVDGENVIEVIDEIVRFYQDNWFNLFKRTR
jgi:hypothetical protein